MVTAGIIYPCFHRLMAEDSAQSVVDALLDTILPLIAGIDSRLRKGIEELDAGWGEAHLSQKFVIQS